jgi:hypothetical protein
VAEDELVGEVGVIIGVTFVDAEGNPVLPPPASRCPECKLTAADGTFWDRCQFWPGGSLTRWRCPNGHVWVT